MCLLAYFRMTQALGARPRWAFDIALYGAVSGVALALALSYIARFAVFDLALSGAIVWWGKRIFVVASGDDALAGQMWFFGWIVFCACAVALYSHCWSTKSQVTLRSHLSIKPKRTVVILGTPRVTRYQVKKQFKREG